MTTTGIDEPQIAPPPAATAPGKNVFQRIAGVLFAPAETFEDIARKPDVVAPLLIVIAISILTTVVFVPRMDFETMTREQFAQRGQEVDEQAVRFGAAFAKVAFYTSPLWGVIGFVVIAGVLLLAFRLFGGEGTFLQAFSATVYSWIPLTIKGIIMAAVSLAHESINPATAPYTLVKSNPAFLVDIKEQPVLFSLLSSFDVFTIWTLILFTFGFAALSKLSRAKSATLVVSLWAAWIVIKVGLAAMGAAMAGKKA